MNLSAEELKNKQGPVFVERTLLSSLSWNVPRKRLSEEETARVHSHAMVLCEAELGYVTSLRLDGSIGGRRRTVWWDDIAEERVFVYEVLQDPEYSPDGEYAWVLEIRRESEMVYAGDWQKLTPDLDVLISMI